MKWKTSISAKIIAWILIAVTGLFAVGSGVLAIGMESEGFYEHTYQELEDEHFATFQDRYSARVLEYLYASNNTNQEYFANKNFQYGVIKADLLADISTLDLNDKSNYVDTNFDFSETLTFENMHLFQCSINQNTRFVSNHINSIWGYYWISDIENNWHVYEMEESVIYDTETGIFFTQAKEVYYPIPNVVMRIYDKDGNEMEQAFSYDSKHRTYQMLGDIPFSIQQNDAVLELEVLTKADWEQVLQDWDALRDSVDNERMNFMWLEGTIFDYKFWDSAAFSSGWGADVEMMQESEMGVQTESVNPNVSNLSLDVEILVQALDWSSGFESLSKESRIVSDSSQELLVYVKSNEIKSNTYFVLSYLKPAFRYEKEALLSGNTDVFGQFDFIFGTLYQMRYDVFGIFFGSLLLFVMAFIFLCCAAGHKKGQQELAEIWLNRIPLEIYIGLFAILETFSIAIMQISFHEIDSLQDVFWMIGAVTGVLAAGLLFTEAALEIVTRIKLKIFWKNTICYRCMDRCFGGMKQLGEFLTANISLTGKIIVITGANAVADIAIFFLVVGESGIGFFVFLLKNAALLLFALSTAFQLKKLKEAGEHMAKGDMTYRVNTDEMYWDFKKHGEHLNSVGEGLSLAVEERMKSERFKTELITNVSHDIKTPLTSIINYVDLIQKEEIHNEKIVEYLEVLERQSKRLKKLLEDLLEASKASTGTLAVGLETLEAGVFVVQTVGEFEEKLAARSLELMIKKPDEAIYIQTDGRHLWRVIDNLMNNICKYAQPNTRVYINLDANAKEVKMVFRNTSQYPLNITSEELMERFVRGDDSRHTEGSGLGLSIAQSLTELMNGTFELVVDGDLFKVILTFQRVKNEENFTD